MADFFDFLRSGPVPAAFNRPSERPYDYDQPYQQPEQLLPKQDQPHTWDEALNAWWGLTGIPDIQKGYETYQQGGGILPAIGQGGMGLANLAGLVIPAAKMLPGAIRTVGPMLGNEIGAVGRTPRPGAPGFIEQLRGAPAEPTLSPGIGHNMPPEAIPAEAPRPGAIDPAIAPAPGVLQFSTPGTRSSNPMAIPPDYQEGLARMAKRGPDVGAPNTPEAVRLPDGSFVGPVNTDQWIARNELHLGGEGIDDAAKWYAEALPAYVKHFGEEKGPQMMGAWLIANQNATPGFAQLSATRALEQYVNKTAGMPESGVPGLAADKLGQYWDAALSKDPEKWAGLKSGQKIYDFIDSAAGKNTRTFYGDDPRAGAPAVADVHTLRDMGTIDPTLYDWIDKNHGAQATYDRVIKAGGTEADAMQARAEAQNAMDRIVQDPAGSPSETKYEWSANRVRSITDDLNRMNYRGRSDWTPEQVQAVGWMGMSKMTGRPGQTAEQAIRSMERNLSYELDFGEGAPFHQTFPEWGTLAPHEKAAVSQPILNQIMDYAKQMTGAQENWRLAGTGAWREDLNPAFRSQFLSSPEVVADVANIIGHLGQQTAVYGTRMIPSGKNFALAVHGPGLDDPAKLTELWKAVYTKHPDLAGGFSPAQDANGVPGIHIGFASGGKRLQNRIEQELLPTIDAEAKRLGLTTEAQLHRAETVEPINDWTRYPDGGQHLQRLSARYGPGVQQRLVDYSRTELEPAIRREIAKAINARGQAGRPASGAAAPEAASQDLAPAPGLFPPF